MRKLLLLVALLVPLTAWAADNQLVFTPGTGVAERSRDVGSGVQSPIGITDQITTPSTSFTRPANTTPYASGQLIANNTVAGSVVAMSWAAGAYLNAPVYVRRASLLVNSSGVTQPFFRLHLYTSAPTVTNGDGAAFLSSVSGHFCDLDITLQAVAALSAANDGIGVPNNGAECNVIPISQTIYGLLEARGAYVPTSGMTLTITLEMHQP